MKAGMKNLIKSVVFLLILGVLVLKTGVYLRPIDKDADVFPDYYNMEKNSTDVALIGSSALYCYWLPPQAYDEQGFTSSMVYCSGQDIDTVPYMIDELLKTQDPEVILVENRRIITQRVKEIDEKMNYEQIDYYTQVLVSGMKPSWTKYELISDILELSPGEKLEYMLPLLKYHDNIYEYSLGELRDRAEEDMIDNISQLPRTDVEKQEFILYDENEYPEDEITDESLDVLDKIQERAKKYGKRVVFLSMPYGSSARGQKLRSDMRKYMDEKGYEYIDLTLVSDEIKLDFDTDYYNIAHTNIAGAEKVTSYLAKYLKDNYDIDTNHTSSTKEFWSDFVSRWNEKEVEIMKEWEEKCK